MPWTEEDKIRQKKFEDDIMELVVSYENASGMFVENIGFDYHSVENGIGISAGKIKTGVIISATPS